MRVARPVALLCLLSLAAQGAVYENTITIDDEDDLFTLFQRGDISESTLDTLLQLYREGVDLNGASRDRLYDLPGLTYQNVDAILEYRKATGRINDPAELVGGGALTEAQLLEIAPFIRVDPAAPRLPVQGRFRAVTQYTLGDTVAPPAMLQGRVKAPFDLSAGFMILTSRLAPTAPVADPLGTGDLLTQGFSYAFNLPRAFVQWRPGKFRLVAGTFTIGFAERLTLDNTRNITPRGIYLTDDFVRSAELSVVCRLSGAFDSADPFASCGDPTQYITSDYGSRQVFRGLAASVEDVELGGQATLSAYGFASYQTRNLYQYELYDRSICDDPRDDGSSACGAPRVGLPDGSALKFTTLPAIFDEIAGGGHVSVKPSYQYTFGVTGYGALPLFWRTQPVQLDFQEWSRYPNGGAFGAAGVNAAAVFGPFNLFIEGTRSFNNGTGGGGGWGVEQRTTYSPRGSELELSLRFYDTGFGHPYSRPISSPDEFDGQTARNEAGARLRFFTRPSKDWVVRARADFWLTPFAVENVTPAGVANVYALARVDFEGWSFFQPSLWVDVRNRNLVANERGQTCSSGTYVFTEGDPFLCNGDLYRVAGRMEFIPDARYARISIQGWFSWLDDFKYADRFRNDVMVFAEVRSRPLDQLQLRLKSRYLNQAIDDDAYLETSLWTFLEVAYLPVKGTRLAARYDLYVWLDQRDSTQNRFPSPEHRFLVDLRTSF